jgi:hypothetical protein
LGVINSKPLCRLHKGYLKSTPPFPPLALSRSGY